MAMRSREEIEATEKATANDLRELLLDIRDLLLAAQAPAKPKAQPKAPAHSTGAAGEPQGEDEGRPDPKITFAMLEAGGWGLRVPKTLPMPDEHDEVQVTKKSGEVVGRFVGALAKETPFDWYFEIDDGRTDGPGGGFMDDDADLLSDAFGPDGQG